MSYTFLYVCFFIIFIESLVDEIEVKRELKMLDKQDPLLSLLLTVCSVK